MITTPEAEAIRLTYELMRWTGKDWAAASVDADTVIAKLAGPTPTPWTVLHHPMTLWVSKHFEVHWPLASYALAGIVPGKPEPGPGPQPPDPAAVVYNTIAVTHLGEEVVHNPTVEIAFPELTLVAGRNNNIEGFIRGVIGSVTPEQTTQGDLFMRLQAHRNTETLRLRVMGDYPQNTFTTMEVVGVGTVASQDADYSKPGGDSLWVWLNSGITLNEGDTFAVDFA